ncbi:MAG TPA: ATP-binding protein [Opitutaceae bacterium]
MSTPTTPALPLDTLIAERLDSTLVRAFLENVPDFVYFKDRDSRFIAVSNSKAARHGLSPEEMVGKCDADFFIPSHAEWSRADEESIMATGEAILNKRERTSFLDGTMRWSEVTKLPLRDTEGEIIGILGLTNDITHAEETKAKLEQTHKNLLDASRRAGMAEVATGVLHNVGNVLTSLNVSASVISASLHQSKAGSIMKVSELLAEHSADIGDFVANDPKGKRIPEFMESLARHSIQERDRLLQELASLQQNIDHIKEIVSMQQSYATMVGVTEPLDPVVLMEDSLRMNAGALVRHDVRVERDYQATPRVIAEKAKVLQILINLIRNAKYAADEGRRTDKVVTLRIGPGEAGRVRLTVQDNGIGIPPENLEKIFHHGFTTRAGGHGFGLHSSLVVAREMKGTLAAHSDGHGCGAIFTVDLPAAEEPARLPSAYGVATPLDA